MAINSNSHLGLMLLLLADAVEPTQVLLGAQRHIVKDHAVTHGTANNEEHKHDQVHHTDKPGWSISCLSFVHEFLLLELVALALKRAGKLSTSF